MKKLFLLYIFFILASVPAFAFTASDANYTMQGEFTIISGAANSTNYNLVGSGEQIIGTSSGTSYAISYGMLTQASDVTLPEIVLFDVSPSVILYGNSVSISWKTTDNTGVTRILITSGDSTVVNSTSPNGSAVWTPSKLGTNVLTLNASDGAGNVKSQSKSIYVDVQVSPTGAVISLPQETSITIAEIPAGESRTVNISKDVFSLRRINLTASNLLTNIQIFIQETESKPDYVEDVPISSEKGKTYKYVEITSKNINDGNVSNVEYTFRVPVEWISDNNIDPSKVLFKRYENGTWNNIDTQMENSDSEYYYYKAISPGLSVYAVTGEYKLAEVSPPTNVTPTAPSVEENVTKEVTKPSPKPAPTGIIVAIILIIIIVGALIFVKPKNFIKGEKK